MFPILASQHPGCDFGWLSEVTQGQPRGHGDPFGCCGLDHVGREGGWLQGRERYGGEGHRGIWLLVVEKAASEQEQGGREKGREESKRLCWEDGN